MSNDVTSPVVTILMLTVVSARFAAAEPPRADDREPTPSLVWKGLREVRGTERPLLLFQYATRARDGVQPKGVAAMRRTFEDRRVRASLARYFDVVRSPNLDKRMLERLNDGRPWSNFATDGCICWYFSGNQLVHRSVGSWEPDEFLGELAHVLGVHESLRDADGIRTPETDAKLVRSLLFGGRATEYDGHRAEATPRYRERNLLTRQTSWAGNTELLPYLRAVEALRVIIDEENGQRPQADEDRDRSAREPGKR